MTTSIRSKIRSQIQPMPKARLFATGWRGEATFEQIAADLSPKIAGKMARFGLFGQDIPDSIQTGLMRLWTRLIDDPDLLADMDIYGAMWRTLSITKFSTIQKQNKRYVSFADIQAESEMDVDEYGIGGLSNPSEWWRATDRWAVWAAKIDFRLDITEAIHAIAEEYADDIKGLVALYILTTNAESQATLEAHNLAHSMVYERMTAIKHRLQRILKEYEPIKPRTWQERLEAGEVEPYLKVVEYYEDRPLALFAIYTLTTQTKIRKFAKDEKERKMIMYYRKKCLKSIEAAYGKAASF